MSASPRRVAGVLSGILGLCLTGCGDPAAVKEARNGVSGDRNKRDLQSGLGGRTQEQGSLFGAGGVFGPRNEKDDRGTGVAVNTYLWRASLDTINFIPLVSADAIGGVIITDWHATGESPNQRMKVQVTILDRALRTDGVRVSVFKQQSNAKAGGWVDAAVDPQTSTDIENAIRARARELRAADGS